MKILIFYALKSEASSILHSLSMIQYMHNPDVYRSENMYVAITGIGFEQAFKTSSKAIEIILPDYIINAGSAGSLSGTIHTKIICHITDVLNDDSEPIKMTECSENSNSTSTRLYTSRKPLIDDNERRSFSETADCVDMEGYAIALSAKKAHIPCSILKIITDTYGDSDIHKIRRSIIELSGVLNAYIIKEILPYIQSRADKVYPRMT